MRSERRPDEDFLLRFGIVFGSAGFDDILQDKINFTISERGFSSRHNRGSGKFNPDMNVWKEGLFRPTNIEG